MAVVVDVVDVAVVIVVIFSSNVVVTVLNVELSVVKTNLGSMNLGLGVVVWFLLALTITPPGTLVMKESLMVVEEIVEDFIAAVVDDDKVVVKVVVETVLEVIGSDLVVTLEAVVLKVVFVDV